MFFCFPTGYWLLVLAGSLFSIPGEFGQEFESSSFCLSPVYAISRQFKTSQFTRKLRVTLQSAKPHLFDGSSSFNITKMHRSHSKHRQWRRSSTDQSDPLRCNYSCMHEGELCSFHFADCGAIRRSSLWRMMNERVRWRGSSE